jgi:hypothetical protein
MEDVFGGTYDSAKRADRYRKVAAEYAGLAKDASAPFLRAYFQRIAQEYIVRADGELSAMGRESQASTGGVGHPDGARR